MAKMLKPGDKVSWNTSQGETHGTVEKKVTSTERVKGHVAKATKADPQSIKVAPGHREISPAGAFGYFITQGVREGP